MAGSLVPVGITALLVPVSPADGAVPDEKPVLTGGSRSVQMLVFLAAGVPWVVSS